MMIHAGTQSVGDYTGKNSIFSDDYDNLGLTRRQQSNDNLLIVNQLLTNWGLTKSLSLDASASYNMVKDTSRTAASTISRKRKTDTPCFGETLNNATSPHWTKMILM